jgi:transposase
MISPSGSYKIYLATQPVDFRKGMDGLAGYVINNFDLDPFTGAFFVFRVNFHAEVSQVFHREVSHL